MPTKQKRKLRVEMTRPFKKVAQRQGGNGEIQKEGQRKGAGNHLQFVWSVIKSTVSLHHWFFAEQSQEGREGERWVNGKRKPSQRWRREASQRVTRKVAAHPG